MTDAFEFHVPPSRGRPLLWILATNAFLLVGVFGFGWPAGNVLLLFWIENVLMGLVTLAMILTARAPAPAREEAMPRTRGGAALFFAFHYGFFCAVHLAFTAFLAMISGWSLTWWTLGFPAVLIAVRYLSEFANTWILGDGRLRARPRDVVGLPYPRMIVLHVVTLLGWGAMFALGPRTAFPGPGGASGFWPTLRSWLHGIGLELTLPVVLVSLLVVVKTLMELLVTRHGFTFSAQGGD